MSGEEQALGSPSDADLFSSATSDPPPAETPASEAPSTPAATPAEHGEQPRDPQGRFMSPQAEPLTAQAQLAQQPPPADPGAQQQQPHSVPLRELLDERERRQNYERMLEAERRRYADAAAQLQRLQEPPKEAPDFFQDPNAFLQHHLSPIERKFQAELGAMREMYSQRDAIREFGEEAVVAAFRDLTSHVDQHGPDDEYRQIAMHPDPHGAMVRWHQRREAMRMLGDHSPQQWFAGTLEGGIRNDAVFRGSVLKLIQEVENAARSGGAPPAPGSRPQSTFQIPPSLNGASAAAPAGDADLDGSDGALWRAATR